MNLVTVLIVLLLLGALGGFPWGGYHSYGYGPSGGLGLLLIILIIVALVGRRG